MGGHCACYALRIHAGDRRYRRRRTKHGRCAARVPGDCVQLFRPFSERGEDPAARVVAKGHLLYYGRQQVADIGDLAPAGAQKITLFLSSAGHSNSLTGDGVLVTSSPAADKPDTFTYDPMNPVPSYSGNVCCTGSAVQAGAFDQRKM